jgi:GT2 family glycosyltransferase
MVSVVLVNWNRATDILDNIRWLKNQTWSNLEIIVVDNGSRDESLAQLRTVDGIRLIQLSEKTLDQQEPAMKASAVRPVSSSCCWTATAIWDVPGWPSWSLGCRVILHWGFLVAGVMNWYSGDIDQWFYPQSYETMGDTEFETYSFSGAGALLRTSAVKQAGGFWDDLFIYNEEVDLSIGVIRAGYRILYVPNVPVFHRSSKTGRVPTARFFYYQIRNWIWILYRHYPFWQRSVRVGLLSACM